MMKTQSAVLGWGEFIYSNHPILAMSQQNKVQFFCGECDRPNEFHFLPITRSLSGSHHNLDHKIELASLEAGKEAFGGIYSVEQLSTKFNRDRVIKTGFQLLQLTYQEETKKLPQTIRELIMRSHYLK